MEQFKQLQSLISPKFTWGVFESVLKKQNNCDDIQIINLDFGKGIKKGDSYASTITRFTVMYSGNVSGIRKVFTLHVLVKVLIRNIAQRKTFRCDEFFKNEIYFYEKVWPVLNAFQEEMNVKEKFQEIPQYLCGYCDGVHDYILMEDLSFKNYGNVDRSIALDLNYVKSIIRIFARFHALGLALKSAKPQIHDEITNGLQENYFHERIRYWYEEFQKKLINIGLDAVEQELPADYYIKIKEIFDEDIFGKACRLYDTPTKFTTITQGDAWIANFMVNNAESTNESPHSMMIDFQLARHASIAQDLHFFLNSCAEPELLSRHFKEILLYYCQEYNAFYSELCPNNEEFLLTIAELDHELKINGIYGLSMPLETILLSLFEDDEVTDFEKLEGNEAQPLERVFIVKPLETKKKRQRLAKFIKHMIDNNFV